MVLDDDVRVRLIGINAPEKKSDSKVDEPFSLEARLLLQSLVLGKKVRVIRGIEPFDKYRRSLAYLELEDGTDVQESLLEAGYVSFVAISPNIRRIEQFQKNEYAARGHGRGIWNLSEFIFEAELTNRNFSKGFNIMRSTVSLTRESKNQFFIELNNGLIAMIAKGDWDKYWSENTVDQYLDTKVEVRGWVFSRGDQYMVKITHPSMIVQIL